MFRIRLSATALAALGCLAFLACSGSSSSSTPASSTGTWSSGGSTSLKGTMAGTATGSLDWTVGATFTPAKDPGSHIQPATANTVTISGTAKVAGVNVTLSGTFDAGNPTAANSVQVSGASTTPAANYTFTGTAAGGKLVGDWSNDVGGSGHWSVLYVPTGGSVEVYQGSYQHTDLSDNGYFNLEISSDGHVSGNYASQMDPTGYGQVTGVVITAAKAPTASSAGSPGTFGGDILDKNGAKIGTITQGSYSLDASPAGNVSGSYSVGSPAKTGGFDGNN